MAMANLVESKEESLLSGDIQRSSELLKEDISERFTSAIGPNPLHIRLV